MKVVDLAEAKDDDLVGSSASDGGPGECVDEPQVTIGRVCGLWGLEVEPKAGQQVGGLEFFFCTSNPICQCVFIDIVVFDKTGSRPRLIEYRNEPVTGAKKAKENDRTSCVVNRISTTSSRCRIRAS
jgi:hypothetical protein